MKARGEVGVKKQMAFTLLEVLLALMLLVFGSRLFFHTLVIFQRANHQQSECQKALQALQVLHYQRVVHAEQPPATILTRWQQQVLQRSPQWTIQWVKKPSLHACIHLFMTHCKILCEPN
jgi:type II secretory pathway pseudopilin PulG